jgi:hypothetical protein
LSTQEHLYDTNTNSNNKINNYSSNLKTKKFPTLTTATVKYAPATKAQPAESTTGIAKTSTTAKTSATTTYHGAFH